MQRQHLLDAGRANVQQPGQDRRERGDLHRTEAGDRADATLEVAPVGGIGPDPGRVAVVLLDDV